MKKIFLIGALCFFVLTESVNAKAVKLWKSGEKETGRGLAVRDNNRTICPKGKTKSGSGVCVSCETVLSNCERCSSTTVCTKCKKGYLVKDGKCEKEGCDTDSDCESNQACDTIARKCETLNCPRGKYLSDHKCLNCPAECTECTRATVCTACQTNYELNGTECTQIVCPAGEYVEHSACHPCSEAIASCIECATSKTCTKCDSDMVLIRGNCVEPKCQTDADCREAEYCDGKTKICETVTCDEGYEVREHTCVPAADPECDENTDCEEDEICVDGGTETAACKLLDCDAPNQKAAEHECVLKTCSEINQDYNLSCQAGETKTETGVTGSDGACYTCSPEEAEGEKECPTPVDTTCKGKGGPCVDAPIGCADCDTSTGTCKKALCPNTSYPNGLVCYTCSFGYPGCKTCANATTCTSCADGYVKASECPAGKTWTTAGKTAFGAGPDSVCGKCEAEPGTCSAGQYCVDDDCTRCATCPNNTYMKQTEHTNKSCLPCHAGINVGTAEPDYPNGSYCSECTPEGTCTKAVCVNEYVADGGMCKRDCRLFNVLEGLLQGTSGHWFVNYGEPCPNGFTGEAPLGSPGLPGGCTVCARVHTAASTRCINEGKQYCGEGIGCCPKDKTCPWYEENNCKTLPNGQQTPCYCTIY